MAKQYKNVYTILEKVRKGEIKSHYKDREGLFGKINFYKKPDLVTPNLHYMDEHRLEKMMDNYITDAASIESLWKKLSQYQEFKSISQKPDIHGFHTKVREKYSKFPKHILRDIFKMYYNRIEKLSFEQRNEKNHLKYKFLEKANNPIGKIMSEGSNLKSAIFARNVFAYLLARLAVMDYIDPNMSKDISKNLEGASEFDTKDIDDALDKMLDSKCAKSMLEEAVQKAQDLCKEMDDIIPDYIQDSLFDKIDDPGQDGQEASRISADYVKGIAQRLENIKLSMSSVKDRIKKLLDKSISYFSAATTTRYEDMLNSDNIAGIEDYIELHPTLRRLFIEDVMIKDHKRVGKIDLYIDASGSMASNSGSVNLNNKSISKLEFAKAFAVKLEQMDMLNDVYIFTTTVKKLPRKDAIAISFLDSNGGTTINNVIKSIEQNGNNALVITDAEDHCKMYSDKAFFIGVEGARFDHFDRSVLSKYTDRGQMIIFDGERMYNVDKEGGIITKR